MNAQQRTERCILRQREDGYKASTRALYETYRVWCADNAEKTFSSGEFSAFLRENQERYRMKCLNNNLYMIQRLWLTYYNDTLYDKGVITEEECNRMRVTIKTRAASMGR